MKIKEVEEKTKLTSKTIRFYEDKGLLSVLRDSSGYRDYTQENVEELLKIKLFRRCGLSIQEIIDIQKDDSLLEKMFYDKISEFDKKDLEISYRKDLCVEVIKAHGNYQKLYETMDSLESEEFQKLVEELTEIDQPSLGKQVIWTLVLLGPLLNCFFFLADERYERLKIALPLSFLSTIILTISWQNFLKKYKFYRESWFKGCLHTFLLIGVVVIGIIGLLMIMIALSYLQCQIFMGNDVFMISIKRSYMLCFIAIGLEVFLIFMSFLSRISDHPNYQDYDFLLPLIKKHKGLFFMINFILFYLGMINVTVCTTDQIICHSTFHPQGIVYQYDDVKQIDTGFYENGTWMLREKGDFYYRMTMNDGNVISIEDTQTIPEYEEDTYSELVVLDQKIMQHHPLKKGDDRYSDELIMDQIYIDRFLSIVHNQ